MGGVAHIVEAGPPGPGGGDGIASRTDCGLPFDRALMAPTVRREARGLALCAPCDAEDERRYGPQRHNTRIMR